MKVLKKLFYSQTGAFMTGACVGGIIMMVLLLFIYGFIPDRDNQQYQNGYQDAKNDIKELIQNIDNQQ